MPQSRSESTSSKLDLLLKQQAEILKYQEERNGDHSACLETRMIVEYVKEKQDEYIEENCAAHGKISESIESIDKIVIGNGKVGLAEEVRILKRGYRAMVWLGGVVATGIVVQTLIVVREHFWPQP